MHSLKKFLSSSLLLLLTFFAYGSALLSVFGLGENSIIITSTTSIANCSLSDYHCEKIDETTYLCERNSQISSNQALNFREFPSNQTSPLGLIGRSCFGYRKTPVPHSIGNHYSPPEGYQYPFVRIIKIQV